MHLASTICIAGNSNHSTKSYNNRPMHTRLQNRQVSRRGRIHLDSYTWTLDKPTDYLSVPIWALAWMAILFKKKGWTSLGWRLIVAGVSRRHVLPMIPVGACQSVPAPSATVSHIDPRRWAAFISCVILGRIWSMDNRLATLHQHRSSGRALAAILSWVRVRASRYGVDLIDVSLCLYIRP